MQMNPLHRLFVASFDSLEAIRLLTRLPLPVRCCAAHAFARSAVYFPLVGGLIGIFTSAVLGAAAMVWDIWLAALLALAAEAWLTGALHEDGLADFFDAFGGGWTREEVLDILKDSRLGSYGALALLLAVSLRFGAMTAIIVQHGPAQWWLWGSAIVGAAAIGRWMILLALMRVQPIDQRASLSAVIGGSLKRRHLLIGTLWGLLMAAPFAVLLPWHFLLSTLLLLPVVWVLLRTVRQRLGGMTGDCLGCICYLSQLVVLMGSAVHVEFWKAG